jgi:hypothetical protein
LLDERTVPALFERGAAVRCGGGIGGGDGCAGAATRLPPLDEPSLELDEPDEDPELDDDAPEELEPRGTACAQLNAGQTMTRLNTTAMVRGRRLIGIASAQQDQVQLYCHVLRQ